MANNHISIRKFTFDDIQKKITWINDSQNNRYLHYDLPLEFDKTSEWWKKNRFSQNRFDGVIEIDYEPAGLIGLLNIKDQQAEVYICVDHHYKGMGIGTESLKKLISFVQSNWDLETLYALIEENNFASQKAFSNAGFIFSEILYNDVQNNGQWVNRIKMTYSL